MESYYLCINPLKRQQSSKIGYIHHASPPRFFAQLHKIIPNHLPWGITLKGINQLFYYSQSADNETEYYFILLEDSNDQTDRTSSLDALNQAARWYSCVLYNQFIPEANTGRFALVNDLIVEVPGVKILYLEVDRCYLLSYPDGIELFDTFKDLRDFLTELGYQAELFKEETH